jgi:hypothetical protein
MLRFAAAVLGSECFADAVAFLADLAPVFAVPERIHDGVEILGVAGATKDSVWVFVAVVAVAVAAVFFATH